MLDRSRTILLKDYMNQEPGTADNPIPVKFRKSIPGTYATGKGTTEAIRNFFNTHNMFSYTTHSVAFAIGVHSRQLSKRMNELVKQGFLTKEALPGIPALFKRAAV